MAKSIEIDRKKRLRDEPGKGHNRWHPDIAPVIEVEPGEEVTLETRDANDLRIHAGTTAKDLEKLERTVARPLTGPVYVKGAEPGDLLEIEYLDIRPERYGWTGFRDDRSLRAFAIAATDRGTCRRLKASLENLPTGTPARMSKPYFA